MAIPKTRPWAVRVMDRQGLVALLRVDTPTRLLVELAVRQDFPRWWGFGIRISHQRPSGQFLKAKGIDWEGAESPGKVTVLWERNA